MVVPSMILPAVGQFDLSLRLGALARQVDLAARNGDIRSLGHIALELLALKSNAERRLQSTKDPKIREQAEQVLGGVHRLEDRIATLYVLRKVRNRVAHDPLLLGTRATTIGP